MSDRAAWLEQWCPTCHAAPAARCSDWRWGRRSGGRRVPIGYLHVARGWFERVCPTCNAQPGERCATPSGREASRPHTARLAPSPRELVSRASVWDELERRGATIAIVRFSGHAGRGGRTDTITLARVDGEELVDVERWSSRDELCYALEAPVWDRFGTFAGQPRVRGEVLWIAANRSVVIRGNRGETSFEELAA